jgi:hypothetical protein
VQIARPSEAQVLTRARIVSLMSLFVLEV